MSKPEVSHNENSSVVMNLDDPAPGVHGGSSGAVAHGAVCNVPEHQRKHSNPMAIGFGAFALPAMMIGIYNTGIAIHIPQAIMGVALGFGAMGQLICGLYELILGNTFSGTTMLTYSGFWFSYGIMFSAGGGFLETAMASGMHELEMCLGLWQIAFAVPSFIFFIGTFKQPWIIRFLLLQVFLTFFFGGLGAFTGVANLTKAGGWISFTLALTAWYLMAAILFAEEKIVKLPVV